MGDVNLHSSLWCLGPPSACGAALRARRAGCCLVPLAARRFARAPGGTCALAVGRALRPPVARHLAPRGAERPDAPQTPSLYLRRHGRHQSASVTLVLGAAFRLRRDPAGAPGGLRPFPLAARGFARAPGGTCTRCGVGRCGRLWHAISPRAGRGDLTQHRRPRLPSSWSAPPSACGAALRARRAGCGPVPEGAVQHLVVELSAQKSLHPFAVALRRAVSTVAGAHPHERDSSAADLQGSRPENSPYLAMAFLFRFARPGASVSSGASRERKGPQGVVRAFARDVFMRSCRGHRVVRRLRASKTPLLLSDTWPLRRSLESRLDTTMGGVSSRPRFLGAPVSAAACVQARGAWTAGDDTAQTGGISVFSDGAASSSVSISSFGGTEGRGYDQNGNFLYL